MTNLQKTPALSHVGKLLLTMSETKIHTGDHGDRRWMKVEIDRPVETSLLGAQGAAYFDELLAIYDEQSVLSPLEVLMERLEGEAMYHSDLAEQIEIDFGDDDGEEMTAYYEDEVVEAMADMADEVLYAL